MRKALCLAILVSILLTPFALFAQQNWYRDGRVLDMTSNSGPGADFIREFNRRSIASNHPIFLVIVDDAELGVPENYTDTVTASLMEGEFGSALGIPSWMPFDVVAIAIAPEVVEGSPVYDFGVSTLVYNGSYALLGNTALPGHQDFVGLEIAQAIDTGVASGNWQQAVLNGIDQIARAANTLGIGQVAQAATVAPAQPPAVIAPTPQPQIVQTEPTDFGGLWETFKLLAGALILGALIVGVYLAWNKRRQEIETRRASRQEALVARSNAAAGNNTLPGSIQAKRLQLEGFRIDMSEADANALADMLREADRLLGEAQEAHTEAGRAAGDPEQLDLTVAEYNRITARYNAILATQDTVEDKLKEFDTAYQRIQQWITQGETLLQESRTAFTTAQDAVNAVIAQQFHCTEAKTLLDQAETTLNKAVSLLTEKKFGEIEKELETLDGLCAQATESAQNEPERSKALLEELRLEQERAEGMPAHINLGREALEHMAGNFAPNLFADVTSNPEKSEAALRNANDLLIEIAAMLSMERQEWNAADEQLDIAHAALEDAGWLIQSVLDMETNLQQARENAQAEVDTAYADFNLTLNYLRQYDLQLPDNFDDTLQEAENDLRNAQLMLGKALPDYPQIIVLAKRVNAMADTVLSQAQTAVEAMTRQRSAAERAINEARTALTTADSYMDDNRRDMDSASEELYREAESLLQQAVNRFNIAEGREDGQEAERASDYAEAKRLADQAETKADKALTEAKEDVQENAPAPTTVYVPYPVYGSSSEPQKSSRRESNAGGSSSWTPQPSRSSSPSPSFSRSESRPSVSASASRPASRSTPSVSPTSSRPKR